MAKSHRSIDTLDQLNVVIDAVVLKNMLLGVGGIPIEKTTLDLGVFLRRGLAHQVVKKVDGFIDIIAEIHLLIQPGTDCNHLDIGSLFEGDVVCVLITTRRLVILG